MKSDIQKYINLIKKNIYGDLQGMCREAGNPFVYPFLAPGSEAYADVLWDWDSWLSNIALRQILVDAGGRSSIDDLKKYERGCIQNSLELCGIDGWIPVYISRGQNIAELKPKNIYAVNMHKPTLAQHAAFLVQQDGDVEWMRKSIHKLQYFLNNYRNHSRHLQTGLYFWQNDACVGVDNDPCSYYRPERSCGSIYLNCLMMRELQAADYLFQKLGLNEVALQFEKDAESLRDSIQEHCWDEKDGFYYSVDLNLRPLLNEEEYSLHSGYPRDYHCLIQRLGVWSGFLALWAGVATPEQAERIVVENYRDERTFNAPFGVRTLSALEKMYNLRASGNPSSWLGPVWGVSNYMTFRGLMLYGFDKDARDLAEKTIKLFGRDFERFGALHEYYQPENGEPILNRDFQNWNYLVVNMIAWLEGRTVVSEF